MDKEARIKEKIRKLKAIYKDLDKNKLQAVDSLIRTAAFIIVSLEDLQETINVEGYVDEYKNGENQYGTKQSEAVKTHLAMTKNLTVIIKQLADIAPPVRAKKTALQMLKDA